MAKKPTLTPEQKQGVLEANKAGGEAGAREFLQGQGLLEAPEPVSAPVQQQTDQMAFDPAQSPLEAQPVEPVQEPVQPIIDEKEQEVAEPVQPQEVKVEDVQAGKQLQGGESIVSKEDTAGIIAPTPQKVEEPIQPTEKELLDIEATKKEQERVENSEYLQGLQGLLDSDATNDEIRAYAKENQELSNRNKTFVKGMITGAFKRRATAQYTQKYGAMTNEQLRNAVNSGEITEGSKMWNNLTPEQRASYDVYTKEAEAIDPVKGEALELKTENVLSMNAFMEQLNDVFSSNTAKTYRDAMQSESMKGFKVNINDKKQVINDLDNEMEDLEDEVKEQFPNLPLSAQNAIIRDRAKGIQKSRRTAVADYNSALAEYQDVKDELSMELDIAKIEDASNKEKYMLALNMYETRRGEMREDERIAFQEESKIRSENRARSWQLEMKEIDNKMRVEAEQRADNRKITYQTDRMGRMMAIQGGKATLVKDTDGQVVLTENYKDYDEQVLKNSDGTYTAVRTFNDGRPPQFIPYDSEGSPVNGGAKIYDAVAKARVTGQCGEGVNDYLQNLGAGRKFGNSYKQKQSIINVSIQEGDKPPLGGVAIWNPPKVQGVHEYGHVGIVTGYNASTGMVSIHDWNFNGKEQQNDHEVPLSQIVGSGWGFYNPKKDNPDILWDIKEDTQDTSFEVIDIASYNNPTFKPQNLTGTERDRANNFLNKKNEIMRDPDSDIIDVLRFSQGGGKLSDGEEESLTKYQMTLDKLDDIYDIAKDMDTWPILGALRNLNPLDTDRRVLQANLTSIVPGLARGVYGEVGVLTDADVRLYASTLPNLEGTKEYNDAVTAMTLKSLANGYKKQLQNASANKQDVSGYEGIYRNLMNQAEDLENKIGLKDIPRTSGVDMMSDFVNYSDNSFYEEFSNANQTGAGSLSQ